MNDILDNLTVKFNPDTSKRLTEEWTWLIGADKTPILISRIGDMFLKDAQGEVYWLDVGSGEFNQIANGLPDFEERLKDFDQLNEWFMLALTADLERSKNQLEDGQLYSYKKLPIIGGEYVIENFIPLDIEAHFCFTGQIHRQIKDLLDGTAVNVKLAD